MKNIYFTVTNDLSYDQRMQRICGSLARNGYDVTLVGFLLKHSLPLQEQPFKQKRIRCFFRKGKWFYAEYNLRLLLYLLFKKMDAICAIDLDTILPSLQVSRFKSIPRIYDAHELFTELKEVVSRPDIHKKWTKIEQMTVPKFRSGYTVSDNIAAEFKRRYGVEYGTIRNMPIPRAFREKNEPAKPFILYQGAVNEARAFEFLVPAMQQVDHPLVICGDGNFMPQLKVLIAQYKLEEKIILKGMLTPAQLWEVSQDAHIGVSVAENTGLNQYWALPNKFFDYVQAGLPQVTMDFPEYRVLNGMHEVALLIPEPDPDSIAAALNKLMGETVIYQRLRANCLIAREEWNWQQEEKKLIAFYQNILPL